MNVINTSIASDNKRIFENVYGAYLLKWVRISKVDQEITNQDHRQ